MSGEGAYCKDLRDPLYDDQFKCLSVTSEFLCPNNSHRANNSELLGVNVQEKQAEHVRSDKAQELSKDKEVVLPLGRLQEEEQMQSRRQ